LTRFGHSVSIRNIERLLENALYGSLNTPCK